GVGKTVVSWAILAAFAARGHHVAALKPCETGDGDDAHRLIAATGRSFSLTEVSPFRFPLPTSPQVAAQAAGARVDLDQIALAYTRLASGAELTLVEG